MTSKYIVLVFVAISLIFTNCNKEKKLMKGLVGNWKIETSEKAILGTGETEEVYESLSNPGKLVIFEQDPENSSKESKGYTFTFVDSNNDTLSKEGVLITDERNKRIILTKALNDSTVYSDIVWTIEKENKNKQVWSTYGVDSTLFYPTNNQNPGKDSTNWVVWRIELKRD